jgi:hypothetical protein
MAAPPDIASPKHSAKRVMAATVGHNNDFSGRVATAHPKVLKLHSLAINLSVGAAFDRPRATAGGQASANSTPSAGYGGNRLSC